MIPDIKISDYNYNLPDDFIARYPLAQRDQSRLLVYRQGTIVDDHFYHLPNYLPEGALMVFNNTKVIQARLHFRKPQGALIEVFLLEPHQPADYEQMFQSQGCCSWHCLVGNLKKWKQGALTRAIEVGEHRFDLSATLVTQAVGQATPVVQFTWDVPVSFADILDSIGELPIPPYLNRATEESDKTTYQTVYSRIKGSVAAPTAGLHFTPAVLSAIDQSGIERTEVTLHVGAGTFRPVKSESVAEHPMHSEHISVGLGTIEALLRHEARAIAVGTTSVRTLESLYYIGSKLLHQPDIDPSLLTVDQWEPYDPETSEPTPMQALQALHDYMTSHQLTTFHTDTRIIIVPGYKYHIVQMLVTNFHQPQSTLLLLVSALLGGERWKDLYAHALSSGYRFLSYGDSSLLIP